MKLRERLNRLEEQRTDALPIEPTPVLFALEGEGAADTCKRAGVAPGAFCVVIVTEDMSTPRDSGG